MDNETQEQKDLSSIERTFELLSLVTKNQTLTVRDDQFDYPTLLDAVRSFRDKKHRFRLIDTGRFNPFELEWLTAGGADLYTSDEVRTNAQELELINASSKRAKAMLAYFYRGILGVKEHESSFPLEDLMKVGRSGIYTHVTNRESRQDVSILSQLAYNCRRGGSWLVYYHHGPMETSLVDLARNGAWIHISDLSLKGEENQSIVKDVIPSARSLGGNLVLHWEKGIPLSLLDDIVAAGALVLFKSALFDYKSPYRALENKVKRRRLDHRAYYLHPMVLP
jgi:hypothetical protein